MNTERGHRRLVASVQGDMSAHGARQAALGNPPAPIIGQAIDKEHARRVTANGLDYLTPGELAAVLKVSKRTLTRAARDGRLQGWEPEGVGRLVRYRRLSRAERVRSA